MIEFQLIRELTRECFRDHPVWAQYYEPGDIDTLEELGYERQIVTDMIKAVGWSDNYWFPIPADSPVGRFMFEVRRTSFESLSGDNFEGYVFNDGYSIGLFGHTDYWVINENLLKSYEADKASINQDIGVTTGFELLPLQYTDSAGEKHSFPNSLTSSKKT